MTQFLKSFQNLQQFTDITNHSAETALREQVQAHNLCPKLCGLEKSRSSCFAYQLKRCYGACINHENPERYNERVKASLASLKKQVWPFPGPIAFKETDSFNKKTIFHVINQWRYVGSSENHENIGDLATKQGTTSNLDEMKIIQKIILSKADDCKNVES